MKDPLLISLNEFFWNKKTECTTKYPRSVWEEEAYFFINEYFDYIKQRTDGERGCKQKTVTKKTNILNDFIGLSRTDVINWTFSALAHSHSELMNKADCHRASKGIWSLCRQNYRDWVTIGDICDYTLCCLEKDKFIVSDSKSSKEKSEPTKSIKNSSFLKQSAAKFISSLK